MSRPVTLSLSKGRAQRPTHHASTELSMTAIKKAWAGAIPSLGKGRKRFMEQDNHRV